MLARSARLTSPNDFARTTKSGFRLTSSSLVAYLYLTGEESPARCGLIISKSVGGSVVRHRVARQLRHVLQRNLKHLPIGALLVVRALPKSANTDSATELEKMLPRLITKSLVTQ